MTTGNQQPNRQTRRAAARNKGGAPTPLRALPAGQPPQVQGEQVGFMDDVERELIARINADAARIQAEGQRLSLEIVKRHGIDPASGSFQLLADGRIVKVIQPTAEAAPAGDEQPADEGAEPDAPPAAAE